MSEGPKYTIITNQEDSEKVDVDTRGTKGVLPIGEIDTSGNPINPAKEETLEKQLGLSGDGADATFTLTNAATAYAIPETPPSAHYCMEIYNASDTAIYFRFTSGITAGIKIATGETLGIDLGANQQVYIYCALAGKTINISYKII